VELHSGTHGRPNQTYGFVYPRKPRPFVRDTMIAVGRGDQPSAKLPVKLAVARTDDGQAALARAPAASAPAAKPHEHATPKDHQKPQRSATVPVPGPRAEAAKLPAVKPARDHPKAQRSTAAQIKPPAASKASAERHAAPRPGHTAAAMMSKKATKASGELNRAADRG
jgi:hypothetical protein